MLARVSLRLDFDDRIAIVGANGQGKTTLVKSIAQKLPLLQGLRRASKNLRVGYFSQDQLDELRAGENVLDHVKDLIPNASQAAVRALAAQFGFGAEKCETKVDKLSGGEKVRLLMGLTTYKKPHILILDEPTNGLDPMGIAEIRELIRKIALQGKTIILASHLLDEVQKVCTHFAILKKGTLVHTGPVDDVGKGTDTVEVNADVSNLNEILLAFAGTSSINRENGSFQVSLRDGFRSKDLNRFLFEKGIIASHLVTKKKSLEKQFLEILADS